MRPWLSVIMPTYNGERFLDDALMSIAAQAERDVEVVAVDDGSTDGTLDILRRWSRRLRLNVVELRHSGNWVESTRIGTSLADGRYLCWLHQDDFWRPQRLTALRHRLAVHPDAAFLAHPSWYADARGRRIGFWRCPLGEADRLLGFREVGGPLLVQCSIASCGTIFKAEAARAVGSLDTALPYHADWDYWLRLTALGRTLYHRTPLAVFRIHAGSQTIARAEEADARLAEARFILRRHLPTFAAVGGDVNFAAAAASVSAEINHALNSLLNGHTVDFFRLARRVAALGPLGAARLLRDSRLTERCLSRLKAGAGLRPVLLNGFAQAVGRAPSAAALGGLTPPVGTVNHT